MSNHSQLRLKLQAVHASLTDCFYTVWLQRFPSFSGNYDGAQFQQIMAMGSPPTTVPVSDAAGPIIFRAGGTSFSPLRKTYLAAPWYEAYDIQWNDQLTLKCVCE